MHARASVLLRTVHFAVLLDGEQGLPEFAGLFVLRHVRGLVKPDELLAFGRVQRLIVLLCNSGWSDVIVPPLQQKHWDIQSWQHLKQVEVGEIRQQLIWCETDATQGANDVGERIIP
ncbi:MAG: hypothetical protein ACJ8AG_29300 [Ktedonobacteraceae bacterium]